MVTKQTWRMTDADKHAGTVSLIQGQNKRFVLSVSGHALANTTLGDVRLRKGSNANKNDADWAAQQWKLQPLSQGEFTLLHVASGYCLALELASSKGARGTDIEVAPCEAGSAQQTLVYNASDSTLRFSRGPNAGLLVNTC